MFMHTLMLTTLHFLKILTNDNSALTKCCTSIKWRDHQCSATVFLTAQIINEHVSHRLAAYHNKN